MVSKPPMSCSFIHKYNSSHFGGHNTSILGFPTDIDDIRYDSFLCPQEGL